MEPDAYPRSRSRAGPTLEVPQQQHLSTYGSPSSDQDHDPRSHRPPDSPFYRGSTWSLSQASLSDQGHSRRAPPLSSGSLTVERVRGASMEGESRSHPSMARDASRTRTWLGGQGHDVSEEDLPLGSRGKPELRINTIPDLPPPSQPSLPPGAAPRAHHPLPSIPQNAPRRAAEERYRVGNGPTTPQYQGNGQGYPHRDVTRNQNTSTERPKSPLSTSHGTPPPTPPPGKRSFFGSLKSKPVPDIPLPPTPDSRPVVLQKTRNSNTAPPVQSFEKSKYPERRSSKIPSQGSSNPNGTFAPNSNRNSSSPATTRNSNSNSNPSPYSRATLVSSSSFYVSKVAPSENDEPEPMPLWDVDKIDTLGDINEAKWKNSLQGYQPPQQTGSPARYIVSGTSPAADAASLRGVVGSSSLDSLPRGSLPSQRASLNGSFSDRARTSVASHEVLSPIRQATPPMEAHDEFSEFSLSSPSSRRQLPKSSLSETASLTPPPPRFTMPPRAEPPPPARTPPVFTSIPTLPAPSPSLPSENGNYFTSWDRASPAPNPTTTSNTSATPPSLPAAAHSRSESRSRASLEMAFANLERDFGSGTNLTAGTLPPPILRPTNISTPPLPTIVTPIATPPLSFSPPSPSPVPSSQRTPSPRPPSTLSATTPRNNAPWSNAAVRVKLSEVNGNYLPNESIYARAVLPQVVQPERPAARKVEIVQPVPIPRQAEVTLEVLDSRPVVPLSNRDAAPRPRFEFALVIYVDKILSSVLSHLDYHDFRSLRAVSKTMKRCVDGEAKELVLQRFLGPLGYRTVTRLLDPDARASESNGRSSSTTSRRHPAASERSEAASFAEELIVLDLRDLDAFQFGADYAVREFALFAQEHARGPLPVPTLRLIRAATRAWNRVVLRIRQQHSGEVVGPPYAFAHLPNASTPVFKAGRAATLRVWVPAKSTWMDDAEVVECEKEVWRPGVWKNTRRGDIVHNVAISDIGNEGKLISDGKYLRDFQFLYDAVGHLPPWLDMLAFSPGYFHNVIATSGPNPVFYLSLENFVAQIRETLLLCDEKVKVSSPQGSFAIKRFVYRSTIRIHPGTMIAGLNGQNGTELVHHDWVGQVVVETDGTTEHAASLIAACGELSPFRILRERCRPGKLWIKAASDEERV